MTNDLEPIQRRELSPSLSLSDNGAENSAPPWEEVSAGRYMPRRIRGSYRGRELGWTFVIPSGSDATKTGH